MRFRTPALLRLSRKARDLLLVPASRAHGTPDQPNSLLVIVVLFLSGTSMAGCIGMSTGACGTQSQLKVAGSPEGACEALHRLGFHQIMEQARRAGFVSISDHPADGPLLAQSAGTLNLSRPIYVLTEKAVESGVAGEVGTAVVAVCKSAVFQTLIPLVVLLWPRPLATDPPLPEEARWRTTKCNNADEVPPASFPDAVPASRPPQATTTTATERIARRYPNQICEDSVLDGLQSEKDALCNQIAGESCSPSKVSPKRLARRSCSEVKLRLMALLACLAAREQIQLRCFGNIPDQAHTQAIEAVRNGITACLTLQAVNCAPGHPMADL